MKIPSIPDEPMIVNGEIQEPLEKSEFDINFLGINGKEVKSNVRVRRKIWFAPSTRTFSNLISVTVRKNMFISDNLARHLIDLNLSKRIEILSTYFEAKVLKFCHTSFSSIFS